MKKISFISISICLTIASMILTASTSAQNIPATHTNATFEVYDHVNGNELIKNMISAGHSLYKNRNVSHTVSKPKYILNRIKPTFISFDGLDYLIQNDCVLAVKGINLTDDALSQITEKLSFLDQAQFSYHEKINLVYHNENNSQKIRNLNKWYLLTLRILSTTLNDFANLTKRYDAATLAENLAKMRVPNIDVAATQKMQNL